MRPFADPEELRNHLGTTEIDIGRAVQLLMQASDLIRAYIGRRLIAIEETIVVDGTGQDVLVLPDFPVTAIASVTIDEDELEEDAFTWSSSGSLERTSGCWPQGRRNITVAYSHGGDPIALEAVKHVCLAMAGNALAFREQISSDQFGTGVPEARGFPPQMTLTVAARDELDPYRDVAVP